jgi:hypothetical protein
MTESCAAMTAPRSASSLKSYQVDSCVVHASDLTRAVLVRLPWDYGEYGIDAGEQLGGSAS